MNSEVMAFGFYWQRVCHKTNGLKTGIFWKICAEREWQINDGGVSDLIRLFADNPLRVFVATQPGQLWMSQVPFWRPFLKFNLPHEQRL